MDREFLYRFFEGKTSSVEEDRIRTWLEASPENERYFYRERKLFDNMILLADEKKIEETIQKRFSLKRFSREFLKVASIIVLTILTTYSLQYYNNIHEVVPMQTVSVPAGQRINLILPDGTDVWLNARTTLQYPIHFNQKNREVTLDGEAYFNVSHDSRKAFLVQTEKGNISVLGTEFNVDAYSDSERFETALMRGRVVVISADNPSDSQMLTAGNKVEFADGKLIKNKIEDYNPYRWKEGLICFQDKSFYAIMKNFEKSYGIRIEIVNKKVLDHSYSGKFRQTDGIDYALRVLQKDIQFSYSRDDENNIIYII